MTVRISQISHPERRRGPQAPEIVPRCSRGWELDLRAAKVSLEATLYCVTGEVHTADGAEPMVRERIRIGAARVSRCNPFLTGRWIHPNTPL